MKMPSVVNKLIRWQAAAMALAWLVLSAWLLVQMMAFGNGDLDRRMFTFAQVLAESASSANGDPRQLAVRLKAGERIFVDGVISGLESVEGYVPFYQVWSADGHLLFNTKGAPSSPLAGGEGRFQEQQIGAERYRTVAAMSADRTIRVDIAESTSQRWASNWPLLRTIGLGQLLIFSWCVAVTWVAARRGFEPLTSLADELASRQTGDLTPLAPISPFRETAPIVDAVNGLLEREGHRLESERGFLADAAHELRTPLAAINAQAHLLVTSEDVATRQRVLTDLQNGSARVSHLLSQLLTLARLETMPTVGTAETLDLAELCRERLASLAWLARARSIALQFDAPPELRATFNRASMISIIDNLVDNAIRYTPSGGHVEVRLGSVATGIELQVRDDGPGIAPEFRERIFDRFYRVPGNTEQGSGLGLAIVKRVMAAHAANLRFVEGLSGRGLGILVAFDMRPRSISTAQPFRNNRAAIVQTDT